MPHNAKERKALLLILKTDYQRRPIFSRFAKKKNGNSFSRPQIRVILSPDSICSLLAAVVSCYHYATFQINKYLQVGPKPSVCK